MKKVNIEDNNSLQYRNVTEDEPKTNIPDDINEEAKEEAKNQPEQQKYTVVDPKKRKMLYFTMFAAFIIVVGLIIVNFQMTKQQNSEVVTTTETSITAPTEIVTDENGNVVTETTTMETTRVIPTYSLYGTWRSDDGFLTLGFDQEGHFLHSTNIGNVATTYTGNYSVRYGDFAIEAAGYKSADDISAIFHVSKEDLNLSNLAYIECTPNAILYNDGTQEKFTPGGEEGEEEHEVFFSHLVYMSENTNGKVILTYYDAGTDMSYILNSIE